MNREKNLKFLDEHRTTTITLIPLSFKVNFDCFENRSQILYTLYAYNNNKNKTETHMRRDGIKISEKK